VSAEFIPFAAPWIGQEEIDEVVGCLRSGWLTRGQKVAQFETEFAAYIGARHALAVNSCTSALHLALEAVGVGDGDEIITTPMTFTATAAVIEHLGARPVFVDCEADTLNLDAAAIERAITTRTRGILPVHYAGQACDMEAILALARSRNLRVIEDAAHALPTRRDGRMVGTFGDVTCFSFYATKNLTTGEGGMVVTNDETIAERVKLMHLHGMSRDAWNRYTRGGAWSYEVLAPGFKYNMTDLAAAIGIHQLRKCDAFHARRLEIARRYSEAFAHLPGITPPRVQDMPGHAWHLYVIQVDAALAGISRDAFIERLTERGIGTSVHFIPLHVQPYYREKYDLQPADFPQAFAAYQRILSLPIYAKMSDAEVARVIDAVSEIAAARR
jgi:dTDP-4-amino-4,6-dideoxygalactose transaminase